MLSTLASALSIVLSVLIGLPLILLIEVLLLVFCGIRWLPPLSCILNKGKFTGEYDAALLPPHPEVPPTLMERFDKMTMKGMVWLRPKGDVVADRVRAMCELMLAHNVVKTVGDVPATLQGVFWMDGNKIPEELVCLAYATAAEMDGKFVVTKVNSALSWTYLNSDFGKNIASFQESPTPSGMQVFSFTGDGLNDGEIYSATSLNYQDINWLTSLGKWTMERLPGPGVNYKRGCYWFDRVFGRKLEFGSYTLRKIMDEDRKPVEPAYGDFVKYMESSGKGLKMIIPAAVQE